MRQKAYGTHDIARICQVTPPTIGRWIEEGLLPSFTTGGGHRRVWDDDLVVFLRAHNIPIPAELDKQETPLRFLIVDDEARLRQLVQRVLKKNYPKAEVYEAEDGFDAGSKIIGLHPALVFLDLRLPGMDGFKVCESVKKNEALKAVKILAITGYDVERSRAQMLAAGADGFLAKPFRPEALLEEVARIIPAPVNRP